MSVRSIYCGVQNLRAFPLGSPVRRSLIIRIFLYPCLYTVIIFFAVIFLFFSN